MKEGWTMSRLQTLSSLATQNQKKILLWVFDGIGGLPHPQTGLTELETARTPHIDALAARASLGRTLAFGQGVTPGSGPGHLALFGYPNDQYEIGRGVLEVLGSDKVLHKGEPTSSFGLRGGDIAARGNYATRRLVDGAHLITDRRAGKPKTEEGHRIAAKLSARVHIPGVELFFFPGEEHRFSVVFRGEGLAGGLSDTDPQVTGKDYLPCQPHTPAAAKAAQVVNDFLAQACEVLADEPAANAVLLRGLAEQPAIPTLPELYGLRCGAIAAYPMYRGIAKLLGFEVLGSPHTHREELDTLKAHYADYDLFYFHIKETDSVSHLGLFDEKVAIFERCDALFQEALDLGFDVVIVTGDHCTPSVLKEHSWHPIPTLLWHEGCLNDAVPRLTERGCAQGALGTIPATDLIPLALAASGKLLKYGA
jgi:2,3-bisphosphoglycerate-independent phosphoglycerate mutase